MSSRAFRITVQSAVAAAFCVCASVVLAGEKLELSLPREKADFQVEPQRLKPKSNANLDTSKGPDLGMPSFFPTPSVRRSSRDKDEDDKKRNWIFATPEDSAKKPEEIFGVKNYADDQDKKSKLTFFGHPIEDSRDKKSADLAKNIADAEKKDQADAQDARTRRNNESFDISRASLRETMPENNMRQLERAGSFSEFWNERLNLYGANTDQGLARRAEFNQIFENRGVSDPINSFNDATRQPVNPMTSAPNDLLNRSSQNTSGDFQNYNLQRNSSFDTFNNSGIGQIQSTLQARPADPIMSRQQPAVLPFPTRPGELFKRPGGF